MIVAFPTSISNRFRLVATTVVDGFQLVRVYDKNIVTGIVAESWISPVFYTYVGVHNGEILLFGGSNDPSPQDIFSYDVQTGETRLLANDVGNVTEIAGNKITYQAFVEIPFDDENPNQEIPVGPEKTINLD